MAQEILCAATGEALLEGTWVYPARWGYPDEGPLNRSFLWKVERRKGKLVLVAQDTYKILQITEDIASYVGVIHPSKAVSILDYPAQWQAWRADGWGIYLMDTFDHGIMISAKRRVLYTCRISGKDFAECLRTPGGMEEFLMESLHSANHPRRRKPTPKKEKSNPADNLT